MPPSLPDSFSYPLVSVVMSVHNAKDTVEDAVSALLGQTYEHLEIILIDDGSTDGTSRILKRLAATDARIQLTEQENFGLTVSLNRGIAMATGKYIARQDADDFSYPERIEKQVSRMEGDPDIALCGSNCDNVFPNGLISEWGWKNEQEITRSIRFKTPFAHSTAMFRVADARKLGGYDESFPTSQDMEFWIRLSSCGRVIMLEEPLIRRHILESSVSLEKRWRQTYDAFRARWKHNPEHRVRVLYHTLRSFMISLLPDRIIAARQGLKHE